MSSNCSISCTNIVSVKYLGICVDECPPSYYISNGKCKKCPYDQPYVDKTDKNIEYCTSACNFGYEANSVTKKCESCLLQIKVYYNGKCYDTCPEGTQYYESYGSCFGYQTEKNPFAELYSQVKPIKSSLFYDSTAETFNPRAFNGIELAKNETSYCEEGKGLLNYNCIECKLNNMRIENNQCVNEVSKCKYLMINYRNETEVLLSSKNSTNTNSTRNLVESEITPYLKCADTCNYSVYKNTCLNCTDIGLKTTSDGWGCTTECEYGYGPYYVNSQCKKCENIYFEGFCVDKCYGGFSETVFKNERVCRIIVNDPYCNEFTCSNSGICNIKRSGEAKCDCSKTGYYGALCDKTEDELNNVYQRMNTYINLMLNNNKRNLDNLDNSSENNRRNLQINLLQIKKDLETYPELAANYTDILVSYADSYLLSKLNSNKNTTMNELFTLVDLAFTSKKNTNKTSIDTINSIEGIKMSIMTIVESLILNMRNINEYIKAKKGIVYYSNNFAVHISDNSFESKTEILKKKLPYVDFTDCEKKMREEGFISLTEKLFMINIVYDSFLVSDLKKIEKQKVLLKLYRPF